MVEIKAIRLHQLVRIGKLTGYVQGVLRQEGKTDMILVSFPNVPDSETGKHNGIWNLLAYPPEVIDYE